MARGAVIRRHCVQTPAGRDEISAQGNKDLHVSAILLLSPNTLVRIPMQPSCSMRRSSPMQSMQPSRERYSNSQVVDTVHELNAVLRRRGPRAL